MQLGKKKMLAAKVLKVGKDRVIFVNGKEEEIKEAITRQDILDLHKIGAIKIREVRGRRKVKVRKYRRGIGKVRKKVNTRKKKYVILVRRLRACVRGLMKTGKIDKEKKIKIRKMIRAKKFKSRRHLNESIGELK